MRRNLKNTSKRVIDYISICCVLLYIQSISAQNPIIRNIYTADPSAHVWLDGRLYVYPSHDIDPPKGCDLMDQYHVYSTDDMVHWQDHGEILRASQVSWGRAEGGFMWAPDCAYKNGTYYFYFPHPSGNDWGSTWKIGVATSQKPASDFTVQGYIPGLEPMIDPCVFIDEDGVAYFYYGGGGICKGGKLKDNMIEIDGDMKLMTGLEDFHEASWVHKRNGIYYLSYSDNNLKGGNQMRYAISGSPLGPWISRGVYMEPTGSSTNHGSIIEYKGQWYSFYHNSALSGHDWLRSVCIDSLYYDEEGNILKVKQTRLHGTTYVTLPVSIPGTIEAENYDIGGQGVSYSDNDKANNGNQYRTNEGVDIESLSTGGYNVGWTNSGEWLEYSVQIAESGLYSAKFVVASPEGNARVHLLLNGKDLTGTVNINSTGGWQNYSNVVKSGILLTEGRQIIQLFEETGGFNIDKIIFEKETQTGFGSGINNLSEIKLFPNPADHKVTFLYSGNLETQVIIHIYNLSGRKVLSQSLSYCSNGIIDISMLPPGTYLIGIQTGRETQRTKLLVK